MAEKKTETKTEAKAKSPAVCGHVNLHAMGKDGKLLKPKCVLKKGHDGHHTDDEHLWLDAAGKPVE